MKMDEIAGYQLISEIGHGGFGVVHKGVHKFTKRVAAVKVFPEGLSSNPSFLKRFEKEAFILGKLKHKSIVDVFDAGIAEEVKPYIAMELCEGGSLEDRLNGNKVLSVSDAVIISLEVLEALAYSHKQGIIHGDIHPGNILFDSNGNVKIADFGLANIVEDLIRRGSNDYKYGGPYMAPERARGVIIPQNDIYSFSKVFAEMLGREPGTQRPLREINRNVPESLANLIERDLYEYTLRHKDAQEMLGALEAIIYTPELVHKRGVLENLISATLDGWSEITGYVSRAGRFVYENKSLAGLGALSVVALAGGVLLLGALTNPATPIPKPAAYSLTATPTATSTPAAVLLPTPTSQSATPAAPTVPPEPALHVIKEYPEKDGDCFYEVEQLSDGNFRRRQAYCITPTPAIPTPVRMPTVAPTATWIPPPTATSAPKSASPTPYVVRTFNTARDNCGYQVAQMSDGTFSERQVWCDPPPTQQIAYPLATLTIPGYKQVYRLGEKLPFEITLVGAPGAYKEGLPYNDFEMFIHLRPRDRCCIDGPSIYLKSDSNGKIFGDIPLSPDKFSILGEYFLTTVSIPDHQRVYEGYRKTFRSGEEGEKYGSLIQSIKLTIQK